MYLQTMHVSYRGDEGITCMKLKKMVSECGKNGVSVFFFFFGVNFRMFDKLAVEGLNNY